MGDVRAQSYFNEPVNPAELGLDDYFDVIKVGRFYV